MNVSAITVDVDWAPDFVIEEVAQHLIDHSIKSTWFITHESDALKKLFLLPDLFEFGIHPNFLPGTTHGESEESVIRHLGTITPKTNIVRTHVLVQSSRLLHRLATEGYDVDLSLFLRETPNIEPHVLYVFDRAITRVPYFWEDDFDTYNPSRSWNFGDDRYHVSGLKIFNFHPMYVYLNMDTMHGYEALKNQKHLTDASRGDCQPYINQDKGVRTFFLGLLKDIQSRQGQSYKVSELVTLWRRQTV